MIVETKVRIEYIETITFHCENNLSKKEAVKQAGINLKEYLEIRGIKPKNRQVINQEIKEE